MSDYERALAAEQTVRELRAENARLAAELAEARRSIGDLCRAELLAWAELVACINRIERIADSEHANLTRWTQALRGIERLMVHEAMS